MTEPEPTPEQATARGLFRNTEKTAAEVFAPALEKLANTDPPREAEDVRSALFAPEPTTFVDRFCGPAPMTATEIEEIR